MSTASIRRCIKKLPKGLLSLWFLLLAAGLIVLGLFVKKLSNVRVTANKVACGGNLAFVGGAIMSYELKNHKQPHDPVAFDDLVGSDKYMKVMPACEGGGKYRLFRIRDMAACTELSHNLAAGFRGFRSSLLLEDII